jgi:uncharacterized protein
VSDVARAGTRPGRRRVRAEVLIVIGLSLGRSGVYAAVNLIAIATAAGGVAKATATLNGSQSERPWLDLTYQLLGIGFALVPVALALFLLAETAPGGSVLRRVGLDRTRPGRDLLTGAALAAVIGVPGLGLYALGRALGLTADVVASGLGAHWWTAGVLVLSAVQNALLEEVVVVAYLLDRLPRLGWSGPAVIAASALLRGSYHLYQGYGPFVGNAVMGVVFALYYRRSGRVLPLVVAHALLDVVAFVGYQYLAGPLGLR